MLNNEVTKRVFLLDVETATIQGGIPITYSIIFGSLLVFRWSIIFKGGLSLDLSEI